METVVAAASSHQQRKVGIGFAPRSTSQLCVDIAINGLVPTPQNAIGSGLNVGRVLGFSTIRELEEISMERMYVILEQSSKEVASLASQVWRGKKPTDAEARTLAACVLRHRRLDVKARGQVKNIDIVFPEGLEHAVFRLVLPERKTVDLWVDNDELAEWAHWFLDQQ